MSFIGAIREDMRSVVAEVAASWGIKEFHVGCSGNFTVERILSKSIKDPIIHSNDVSLYSCAIGWNLAKGSGIVKVKPEKQAEWGWLESYMGTTEDNGEPIIATLLICSEYFKWIDRKEKYFQRMANQYRAKFGEMHKGTLVKVKKALQSVKLASFSACDVVDYVQAIPQDGSIICFAPTYSSGYENLYKKFTEIFEWSQPEYQIFTPERFALLTSLITKRKYWMTLRDHPVEDLKPFLRATIQTTVRARPVYVYASDGKSRLVTPSQKIEIVPWARCEGEIALPLKLVHLTQGQMNALRSEYLNPKIPPAGAQCNLGIVTRDDKLIGAFGFGAPAAIFKSFCDCYLMADFAIRPSIYERLSKLVLSMVVSSEVKSIMEQRIGGRVQKIWTTAFTNNPSSMKYRSIFEIYGRKDGMVNYIAKAGQWSMEDGARRWLKKDGKKNEAPFSPEG